MGSAFSDVNVAGAGLTHLASRSPGMLWLELNFERETFAHHFAILIFTSTY